MLRYTLFYLRTLFGSLGILRCDRTSLPLAVSLRSGRFSIPWLRLDPSDAAYFCVTSLATVGYGDLTPVTRLGRLFTMIYIIAGLGVLSASSSPRSRGSPSSRWS